jgi:hypothetical protein
VLWNAENGQRTVILFFSDLDPSGWRIPISLRDRLHDKFDLSPELVEVYRCALNPDQVFEHHLPHSIDAIKIKDPSAGKFMAWLEMHEVEPMAVELDALDPALLQTIVRAEIQASLDMDEVERQREIEDEERRAMAIMKEDVLKVLPL